MHKQIAAHVINPAITNQAQELMCNPITKLITTQQIMTITQPKGTQTPIQDSLVHVQEIIQMMPTTMVAAKQFKLGQKVVSIITIAMVTKPMYLKGAKINF